MYNSELIQRATLYTQSLLSNMHPVPLGMATVENFFHNDLITHTLEFCNTYDNWQPVTFGDYTVPHRVKMCFEVDTVIEMLHETLSNCTPQMGTLFAKSLSFNGLDIWKDTAGYYVDKHTDNPEFNVSLQIYIKNLPQLATVFEYDEQTVMPRADPNCGYMCDNTVGIPHWMNTAIPNNFTRYSLHATWA